MCATLAVVAGLAVPALGLSACGGGDDKRTSTTAAKPVRTHTTPARPKRSPPPKVPAQVADDVKAVSKALEAAGFAVKLSRGAGRSLAQLQVGDTLVSFYASAGDAGREAAALKKVIASGPGRGAVRASGKRLYISGDKADERFSKVVSTAESAI
ncbi:MAG: hypothetical protein QOI73_1772 [Solirubrobacteraceae bacterium]|nr:hypothetical protein [Solirubrobacteraceae bacterium]